MAQEAKTVVIDTYAIMADLTGQAPRSATRVLERVRIGATRGIIHYLIIYELAYHTLRGRLPFRDMEELKEFVDTYFYVASLDPLTATEAAKIKAMGDGILRDSNASGLSRRRLSVADATTIALALSYRVPIVTGDRDLSYVARKMGVDIVW